MRLSDNEKDIIIDAISMKIKKVIRSKEIADSDKASIVRKMKIIITKMQKAW